MIDDRMEEGIAQEQVVTEIGSFDEIAAQGLNQNTPKFKKHAPNVLTIVLLVPDSPIWLSLLIAAFAFEKPQITVSVPKGQYGALHIKGYTENINIPKDFSFESAELCTDTGNIIITIKESA